MAAGRTILAALWVYGLASFFLGLPAADFARLLVVGLAVVHAVECVVFLPRLRAAPGPLGGHLWRTFLFGVFHVRDNA